MRAARARSAAGSSGQRSAQVKEQLSLRGSPLSVRGLATVAARVLDPTKETPPTAELAACCRSIAASLEKSWEHYLKRDLMVPGLQGRR